MIKDRVCEWYATCSYTGYLPIAPGTWGSALTCIILYLIPSFGNPAVITILAILAYPAVEVARRGETDPGRIVVDEMLGMLIALGGHVLTVQTIIEAFILFRVFDILKPYPVRNLERLPGAYGIIADDILAGAYANVALLILEKLL